MVDDIVFYSAFFFLELIDYNPGTVSLIEAQSNGFELRLALPERISVG
jgi:hypothetical protein